MTLLALLSLALGQTPCPAQTKACPKPECPQVQARVVTVTQNNGCLVEVESEDEIDMTEAEIIADPADDQAIGHGGENNKNTISVGFGVGKNTPAKLTLIYKKKEEDKANGEQITAQFYVFGPVITRCQTTSKECTDGKADEACPAAAKCPTDSKSAAKAMIVVQASATEKCDKCPNAKATTACAKCESTKVAAAKCDECPAAKAAAKTDKCPAAKAASVTVTITKCDECPAAKAAAAAKCDQCPAAKAAAAKCDQCPASKVASTHCASSKTATAKCDQCPATKASVAHCDQCESALGTGDCATCKNCTGDDATGSFHAAGEIVQVQAVTAAAPAKVETKPTTKRRGLIRRR